MTLCENTVPMARMAPSHVDIDAATIPIKAHAPKKLGASWVRSFTYAKASGFHMAQVGKPRIGEQVYEKTHVR